MDQQRIGLLGGSFDPVHIAHLDLANAALAFLHLDLVQFIPAANPWQKASLGASEEQRLAMLKLAIGSQSHLQINPVEILRGGTTYTYDTVSQLPSQHRYFWILGADQLENFDTWHRWQDILHYVDLAVAQRPGSSPTAPPQLQQYLQQLGKKLHTIDFVPTPISATLIRNRLQKHQSVTNMLPPPVEHYIQQHNLYL